MASILARYVSPCRALFSLHQRSRIYSRHKNEATTLTLDESKTNLINVPWRMYTVYENTMDGRDVANFDATQA